MAAVITGELTPDASPRLNRPIIFCPIFYDAETNAV